MPLRCKARPDHQRALERWPPRRGPQAALATNAHTCRPVDLRPQGSCNCCYGPTPPRRFIFNKKVATKAAVLHKMGHDNNNLTIHTKSQQMRFRLDVRVLIVQITHLPKRFFACLYVFSDGRLARGISFSPPTAYQEVVPPKHGSRVTCLNCTLRTPRIGAGERRRSDRDADGSWRLQLIAVSGMRGKGKRGEKCCCCC